MPYKNISELPKQVSDNLPKHAQEIWKEAFNSAYEDYQNPEKRRDKDDDPETIAVKVAWSAVKNKYEKEGGQWTKK